MKTYSVNSILKNNSSLDLRLTFLEINEVDKLRINFDSQLKKAANLSGIYPELPDYSSSGAASLLSKTALDSIGGNLNSQIGAAASSFDSFLKDYPSASIASLMDKTAFDSVRNTLSHFETAMTNRIADSILKDFSSSNAASLLSQASALNSIGSNLDSQIGAAASSFDSFLKNHPSANIASLMDKVALDNVRNTISHFGTAMSNRVVDSILKDFSSSNEASLLSQASALNSIGSNLDSQIGAAASSFDSFLKNHPSVNITSLMDKAALDSVRNTISHFETAMSNRVVDSILKDFSSPDYKQDSEKIDAIILQQQLNNLSKAKDRASFANLFAKLPPWLQNTILALVILNTFLGDIRSAIIDSYVKQFIVCQLFLISCTTDETDLSNQPIQERIKSLRDLPIEGVNGNYFRFVKIEYLNVYSKPNQKSHILDELILGQTVVILKKERNWVEIAFRNENGEIHYGWVFNRYLKKFQ